MRENNISQGTLNSFDALFQRKYAAVTQEAQALLHHNPMDEKAIYDDLNCGKLVKMINFRVTEIWIYAERLRAGERNIVPAHCQCRHR